MNKLLITFKTLILASILLLAFSCTKEEFSTPKNEFNSNPSGTASFAKTECGKFTLIKPPVDFLFLWDNTSSQVFVTDATKAALTNSINLISDRFDYRILMAPLVPGNEASTNDNTTVISATDFGLSADGISRRVSAADAATALSNLPSTVSSEERGLERAYQLINENISHGIFRQNSYLIVVLMSNENDYRTTSFGFPNQPATDAYVQNQFNAFINLRDNILDTEQIRFISLVAHTNKCQPNWEEGSTYKLFSQSMYAQRYQTDVPQQFRVNDQSGNSTPDTYDICGADFLHLFDGLNNSITDVVIGHKYNFWPISEIQSPLSFDPNTIRVTKNGQDYPEIPDASGVNGWRFIEGFLLNQPTRFEPTPGEERSAHMIELFGDAQVTYPECLIVSYDSPTFYFGFVTLNAKPIVSSIQVTINGQAISKSTTNGWEYFETATQETKNTKVQGPNNPSDPHQEASPAVNATSSFWLKFNGTAIFKSGDNVNVIFDPSGS